MLQFLKTIHNEGMLHFDASSETWFWDLQEINTICSTNNIVEFMTQTLSKLDATMQNILKVAACLGIVIIAATTASATTTQKQLIFPICASIL